MLNIALKGLEVASREMQKWAKEKNKQIRKAMTLSLSKEGYRARKDWARDLKTGNLGLAELAVYQNLPGDKTFRRRRKKKPLANLFGGIVYKVDRQDMTLNVGFLGQTPGTAWQARIAEKSQDTYTWNITEDHRTALHAMGIHLKSSTTSVRVPARDIIGTVHDRDSDKMIKNIRNLFYRKMAGERI